MHAELMLLYLLYLWIMTDFHEEVAKSLAKYLSISLPSSFMNHLGLGKYCSLGNLQYRIASYFLLDAFSLACAIQIEIPRLRHALRYHGHFLDNQL